MTNDPDQIRANIEATRADLSSSVNTLADSVNPSHVAKRQVGKVRSAVFGAKDKVMGSAGDAAASVSSRSSSLSDTVTGSPDQVRAQTAGNPMAAGLIAFGAGLLLGSIMPASAAEQRAAAKVKETAQPAVTGAAKQVADHLKEPAQQAVASVKSSAGGAAATVKDEGSSATADLTTQAQHAKDTVQHQS